MTGGPAPTTYACQSTSASTVTNSMKGLSPGNISHQLFKILGKEHCPQDVARARQILNSIFLEVKSKWRKGMSGEKCLKLMERALDKKLPKADGKNQSLISSLLGGYYDCDVSSLIILTIGQELGWPITIYAEFDNDTKDPCASDHVFARWEDESETIDWNTAFKERVGNHTWELNRYERHKLDIDGILSLAYAQLARDTAWNAQDKSAVKRAIKYSRRTHQRWDRQTKAISHMGWLRKVRQEAKTDADIIKAMGEWHKEAKAASEKCGYY